MRVKNYYNRNLSLNLPLAILYDYSYFIAYIISDLKQWNQKYNGIYQNFIINTEHICCLISNFLSWANYEKRDIHLFVIRIFSFPFPNSWHLKWVYVPSTSP